MKNISLVLILILVLMPGMVYAQTPSNSKKLMLDVGWIPKENVEVFEVEGQQFRTVEMLKKYLDKQEAGTTVIWDPGCVRIGDKPLLSTGIEIKDLKSYLEKRGIKFVTIP